MRHWLVASMLAVVVASPALSVEQKSMDESQPGMTQGQSGEVERGKTGEKRSTASMVSAKEFATAAAKDGMAEITLANMALQRSNNDSVKQFANRMIEDHGKANAELKSIAAKEHIRLPNEAGEKLRKPLNKLYNLEGESFDRAYAEAMVEDHQESVALFQQYQQHGKNQALRQFADKTLPILQQHLDQAKSIHASMSGGTAGAGKSERKK